MEFGDVKLSIEAMKLLGKDIYIPLLLNHLNLKKKDIEKLSRKAKVYYSDSDSDSESEPEEKPKKKKTKYISDIEPEEKTKKTFTRKREHNDGFCIKSNYDSSVDTDSDSEPEPEPKKKSKEINDLDIFNGYIIKRKDMQKINEHRNGKKEEIKVNF